MTSSLMPPDVNQDPLLKQLQQDDHGKKLPKKNAGTIGGFELRNVEVIDPKLKGNQLAKLQERPKTKNDLQPNPQGKVN